MQIPIKYWKNLYPKFNNELLPAMRKLGFAWRETYWELDYITPYSPFARLGLEEELELDEKSISSYPIFAFGNSKFKVKCHLSDDSGDPYWCLEFIWWEGSIKKTWYSTLSNIKEIQSFIKTI